MTFTKVSETGAPVTLAEYKNHLRIMHNEQDAYLQKLLDMAAGHVSDMINFVFLPSVYAMKAQNWADFIFPIAPINSITQIKYIDPAGVEQTLAPEYYEFIQRWPSNKDGYKVKTPPALNLDKAQPVTITVNAGSTTTPPAIQAAILLIAARLFESPADPVYEMKTLADRLLKPYKVY